MRFLGALGTLLCLMSAGCVLPEGSPGAKDSLSVPSFVLPQRLVYESTPGHHVIITVRDVQSAPGTFGTIESGLAIQILHPEADWNNDLQKREVYSTDPPRFESIHHRSGVVWEHSGDLGRRFVGRCDDESMRLKMGGLGYHHSDMFVALALAGKTWTQGQRIEMPDGHITIALNKVPNGTSITTTYHTEIELGGDPIYASRLVYGSSPYPRELGRFRLVSVEPADGEARMFGVDFDECAESDPPRVEEDRFFDEAARHGVAGDALATGANIIETSPEFRQWAADGIARWTGFKVSSSTTSPTGWRSWYVTIDYVQVGGGRFDGTVELSETSAGWVPVSLVAQEQGERPESPLPLHLARPSAIRDITWDGHGEYRASLEGWSDPTRTFLGGETGEHRAGLLLYRDPAAGSVAAASLIDGGRTWLHGDDVSAGP